MPSLRKPPFLQTDGPATLHLFAIQAQSELAPRSGFGPVLRPASASLPKAAIFYTIALGVNPHTLTRTIVNHFPTFIARLKDPSQKGLRQKLEEFVDDFRAAPPTKAAT